MPADETFGAPIVEQIDGRDVEFPRLYMDFYGQLEQAVRDDRLALARSACDDARVMGKDRVDVLRDAAKVPVNIQDVNEYLGTESGFKKTLGKSLEKANVGVTEQRELFGKIDAPTAIELARKVVGFLRPVPSDEELVEDQGKPQERKWDDEYALIVKNIPNVNPAKMTWHQYHLCYARARAVERAQKGSDD
jgi:hypothetical protein